MVVNLVQLAFVMQNRKKTLFFGLFCWNIGVARLCFHIKGDEARLKWLKMQINALNEPEVRKYHLAKHQKPEKRGQ